LDGDSNWALSSLEVRGVSFPSGGRFPSFMVFDRDGQERTLTASDFPTAHLSKSSDRLEVNYRSAAFSATVTYAIVKGQFLISVQPTEEKTLKIRAVSDGGMLVAVSASTPGAEKTGFLMRPYQGGELIRFSPHHVTLSDSQDQSWEYDAGFCGIGYNGEGLLVRTPEFGARWTVGTGPVHGAYALSCGLAADFRPRREQPGLYKFWNLPLCEPKVDIQIVPVGDVNGDGVVNWVDLGVSYRQHFIHRNAHLDPAIPISVVGKIDLSALPFKNPETYDQLIKEVQAINFAPQIWWLAGAHSPPGHRFEVPPYGPPDSSHDGPGGFDYFRFKEEAAKAGARIGLHEMFQDTSTFNADFGRVPLRTTEIGEHMGTWETKIPSGDFWAYSKALRPMLSSGQFFHDLREHFKQWDVQPGDTWHWDVFASVGGREDFSPSHPVTNGQDYRDRIEILKKIQGMGIFLTSEGMQEGMAEYCNYSWQSRINPNFQSKFPGGRAIPLTPVLFQGTTYYAASYQCPAWGLLMGGNAPYEDTTLNRDTILQWYFGQDLYWSKICDRTVKDMTETANGWRVNYDQGGYLMVDLKSRTFYLHVGGKVYTPQKSPPSPNGFVAELGADGKYRLAAADLSPDPK
jgi:hypothetical protein